METTQQQKDSKQFLKFLIEAGYTYEQQEKYGEASQDYASALNFMQGENEALRQVQAFLRQYGTIDDNWHWLEFLAFVLKYKLGKEPNKNGLIQNKGLEILQEFCKKHAKEEDVKCFEQLIKDDNANKFSWLYGHHASTSLQHYILPKPVGFLFSEALFREQEFELILAILCNPDNLWAYAALGDLYRYMAIGIKLSFSREELERKVFHAQSLICFEIAIQKFGKPDITRENHLKDFSSLSNISSGQYREVTHSPVHKQQEAWIQAHAGAAICNARLYPEYERAMSFLNLAMLNYSQAFLTPKRYYWAIEYLATAKLLAGISGPFDQLSSVKNLISASDNFANSIPWLPDPLFKRVSPVGQIFTNMHLGMIDLLWKRIIKKDPDPHVLDVGQALCTMFLDSYLSKKGTPFRYPDLDILFYLAHVGFVGAAVVSQKLQHGLESESMELKKWDESAKHFLGEIMAILLKLVVATGPLAYTCESYLGELYAQWTGDFGDRGEEEQILLVAEISQYLLAIDQLPFINTKDLHYPNKDAFLDAIYDKFQRADVPFEEPFKAVLKTPEGGKLIETVFERYYSHSVLEEIGAACKKWRYYSDLIKSILDDNTWAVQFCDLYPPEEERAKSDFSRRMAFFSTSSIGHINF